MGRNNARVGAMQLLYSMELNKDFSQENIEKFFENYDFSESEQSYINSVISELVNNLDSVDKVLSDNLQGWTIPRLATVDREILRVAIFEFLYRKDIPVEVSINEAVEIAKKYSSEESPKFVNGILASILKNLKDESDKS